MKPVGGSQQNWGSDDIGRGQVQMLGRYRGAKGSNQGEEVISTCKSYSAWLKGHEMHVLVVMLF